VIDVDLSIQVSDDGGPGALPVEVVERKGLGHPDTICDALAEAICVRLCRHYQERFGIILHHNVDKLLLCGGSSRPRFGGGEVVAPIEIILAGRATSEHGGERVPIDELAIEACREWLRTHLGLAEHHVKICSKIRPGSGDLARLFARGQAAVPLSNDTSCGAGFAPFTDLERAVLEVERALNSLETKRSQPAIGTDIKVMGVRRGSRIELTIGCAFIDRFLGGIPDYLRAKESARSIALDAAKRVTALAVDAVVNAADDLERGELFLTVTGTSAEAGDDGEVGRGNRTSGLITPYRPMTLEAAAGKNPVSHVGKLYNVAAGHMAAKISERVGDGAHVSCVLVSQIGRRIDDPQVVDVRVARRTAQLLGDLEGIVREIVRAELSRLPELRDAVLAGQESLY
jgi:S-adenosylmethionine synthetase